ncbi:MAG: hypothetical protein AB1627_09145 [Chloroflexota bacterium]
MTARGVRGGPALPGLLALVVALAAGILAPVAGLGPVAPARAADTDLTLVTDAAYEVRPDDRLVRVTLDVVARNHKAETRTRKFWVDRAYLAVLPRTKGFRVSGLAGASVHVARKTAAYTLLRIDFGGRLYGGSAKAFRLSFDLPDTGTSARGQVRIGGSLASFPVWAFSSDGAKGSTVSVTFPAGYDVTVQTGAFDRQAPTAGGGTRLETDPIGSPTTWFAYVVGEREAVFADTSLSVPAGEQEVRLTMRAWEDDPAWAKRVGGVVTQALPVLATDIGLAWPHADPMVVQEAVTRSTGGYAGLYEPSESRIEVAYWADHRIILHELAHGWFNGSLLADRWANEGFASLYAARAAVALGAEPGAPEVSAEVAASRLALNAWPQRAEDGDAASETYGYAASYELARLIAERAGDDALRLVWADAAGRVGAYQPPAGSPAGTGGAGTGGAGDAAGTGAAATRVPEALTSAPDWRSLLDLLEEHSDARFTDLWRTWVVRADELAQLDVRTAARLSYQRTLALADGWALPVGIRDALRAWRFEAAEQLMADARTVLAQREAVEARAARHGLTPPEAMRRLFEAGQLGEASREAEAELNALLALEGAIAARHADPDILTAIGMLGEDPEAELVAARASFGAGDLDAMHAASARALAAWSEAWQEGRRRALFGVAVLATVLVLGSAIFGGIRRSRRPDVRRPTPA